MPMVLIRHADASDRASWSGPDLTRPLCSHGRRQAQRLAELVGPWSPQRVLSSPYARCVQTVAPLAGALGLRTEISQVLAEGAGHDALTLVRGMLDEKVALCTHGDVIVEILVALADEDRLDLRPVPHQGRGSAWVLEADRGRFVKATYIPPGA